VIKHLAVIMDGNRRWATQRGLPSVEGHRRGVKALKDLVKLCPNYGIEYLTSYAFSTENWRRDKSELDFLFKLLGEVAVKELSNLHKENVKVTFLGDISAFADIGIEQSLNGLAEKTKNNTGLKLQIALNYGSLDEMSTALARIKASLNEDEIKALTEEQFASYLYTADCPDPEIILRTGGEKRLSNYLLWQAANSQLVFVDTLWPDFGEVDLRSVLQVYSESQVCVKSSQMQGLRDSDKAELAEPPMMTCQDERNAADATLRVNVKEGYGSTKTDTKAIL